MRENRRLASDAWIREASSLTDWVLSELVVREDCFGGQAVREDGTFRRTTRRGLERRHISWHFRAEEDATPDEIIGIHCTAPDETCGWIAVDIDRHGDECLEGNFRFALHVLTRARMAGLAVILTDSSGGKGGYHIWVLFSPRLPMADARRLVLWLAEGWKELGLPKSPDLFPRNDHLTGKWCGHWLRLPGRHHKRPSWTRVWSVDREKWLRGPAAIRALLELRRRPADVAKIVPVGFAPSTREAPTRRARACRERPVRAAARPEGAARRELALARDALRFVPNIDAHYDDWLEIMMALRELGEPGRELAHGWSEQSEKHHPDFLDRTWDALDFGELGAAGGRPLVTVATLFHRAKAMEWPGAGVEMLHYPVDYRGRRGPILVVKGQVAYDALDAENHMAIGLPDRDQPCLRAAAALLAEVHLAGSREIIVMGSQAPVFDPEPVARALGRLLAAPIRVA